KWLDGIARAVGGGLELVPVAPETLTAQGVAPWAGAKSLPCWLPDGYQGMGAMDVADAHAAGLRIRPLEDVVAGALADDRTLGLDRERKAGLTPEQETAVLASL